MAVPLLQLAGAAVAGRSLLPRALAPAAAALLALLMLIVAPLALLSSFGGSGPTSTPGGVPAAYVPIYRESARAFDLNWLVLASVHKHETGFSTHPTTYQGVNFAGCCAGPFQFNITNGPPSTWDSHRRAYRAGTRPGSYPHPQERHPSVYDDFDAGMAAGSLLRANGADRSLGGRTWNAVRAYNGAGPVAIAYADNVLTQARAWAQTTASNPAAVPRATGAAFVWPVRGPVSSPFCERRSWEACHPGIDIAVPTGTPILAADSGRVTVIQHSASSGGYGNFTCLQHGGGVSTCYAHQQRILVRLGQLVARGQPIGSTDCTGRCYGTHLHFEVRLDARVVCPARYLAAASRPMCTTGSPGS
jgi:murein DD-endopeptidase MepM/ murein hydrolase activator NlpD